MAERVKVLLVTPCIRQQIATSRRLAVELLSSYHFNRARAHVHALYWQIKGENIIQNEKKRKIDQLVLFHFI